jgi:hypothetical protein
MGIIRKCKICIYDEHIKEPPFLLVQIDKMEVEKPEIDHLGEIFALRLFEGCKQRGHIFMFYSISGDSDYDYDVVVY